MQLREDKRRWLFVGDNLVKYQYSETINTIKSINHMVIMDEITTISIRKTTKMRLNEHGKKNESYDTVLNQLIDRVEEHLHD
jgi:hypothetical protein